MLVVIPHTPYGRLGALLSALIVVAAMIGLTMHKDFYAGIRRRDFYAYYTNLSNLLVLLYYALAAPQLYARAKLRALIPHVEFAVMMSILLTHCVFHLLLLPNVWKGVKGMARTREYFILFADNLIIHYLVPWLVILYWLLCSPGKAALGPCDAAYWLSVPLLYLGAVLLRARLMGNIAETQSPYPYPFLDVRSRGAARVALTCLMLLAVCLLVGLAIVAALRTAFALFGAGHGFVLI
ncbi:MAG: Pr6Pr family membrane protein [Clostridia bacterium]|nr:Pr6Pr family membrane protein [Clostridia bacterium]